jgi:hypothetical protein
MFINYVVTPLNVAFAIPFMYVRMKWRSQRVRAQPVKPLADCYMCVAASAARGRP